MTDANPEIEDLMRIADPEFDRVLECVFGIHPHDRRTYVTLLELPGSTVVEFADALERDRSNVSRSLTTLQEKALVERDRKILGGGGYVYQYFPTPIPKAKELMHVAVDEWAADVHEKIDSFGS